MAGVSGRKSAVIGVICGYYGRAGRSLLPTKHTKRARKGTADGNPETGRIEVERVVPNTLDRGIEIRKGRPLAGPSTRLGQRVPPVMSNAFHLGTTSCHFEQRARGGATALGPWRRKRGAPRGLRGAPPGTNDRVLSRRRPWRRRRGSASCVRWRGCRRRVRIRRNRCRSARRCPCAPAPARRSV